MTLQKNYLTPYLTGDQRLTAMRVALAKMALGNKTDIKTIRRLEAKAGCSIEEILSLLTDSQETIALIENLSEQNQELERFLESIDKSPSQAQMKAKIVKNTMVGAASTYDATLIKRTKNKEY